MADKGHVKAEAPDGARTAVAAQLSKREARILGSLRKFAELGQGRAKPNEQRP